MKKDQAGFIPVIIILVILIGFVGVYFLGTLKNKPVVINPTSSPLAVTAQETNIIKPVATPDQTADWKTYINTKHNFLLKHPSNWKLEEMNGNDDLNANPRLVNGKSVIQIYANMDGIGGSGADYVGVPVVISGLSLYKYESENTYGKTKQIGITDKLKQSLGVFKYLNKTYAIFLTYPTDDATLDISGIKTEFDQILSTFKFTN